MVYVDEIFQWNTESIKDPQARRVSARNSGQWCHLSADTEDELHAFAAKIGLKRAWSQKCGTPRVHYDLTPGKRALAVARGATEETGEQRCERMRKLAEAKGGTS